VASGVVVALRALGIDNIVPAEVNAVAAPLVGFIVAAITQKPSTPGTHAQPAQSTGETAAPTLGRQVAHLLLDDVEAAIDSDPSVKQAILSTALAHVLNTANQAHLPQT
jgi:hypothetical protein